ncbi:DEKNAAC102016 [Brettanomyces naardenensis]|uniref:Nucleolar complex-associated protein 3 n=1 Tax=Brettanomyces naardenensis TaxID=13370 RepID=A0A448YJB9_BRENA|nr:DEKNAAC102016 [Brettanomyces naardenensis]
MAKRVKQAVELRQKKRRKEEDKKLETSVFGKLSNNVSDDEVNSEEEEGEEVAEYELEPRHFKDQNEDMVEGLPVRAADGSMQRVVMEKQKTPRRKDEEREAEAKQEEEEKQQQEDTENADKEIVAEEVFDEAKDDQYINLSPSQRTIKVKEDLATMAERLMEEPEENVLMISRILRIMTSHNPVTAKLSLLTLVPVFKSISPGYQVRPLTESERKEKVSKDVQKSRFFEQNLVKYYRKYVDVLARKANIVGGSPRASTLDKELGVLATRAVCELAESLRFFNFTDALFKVMVRRIMRKPASAAEYDAFKKCVKTLEALLIEDAEAGNLSFDIVRFLCRAIRHREFRVDESVINIFLSLAVLGDYDPVATAEEKEMKMRTKKNDRVYLTKKQRKQYKERKQIEKEMDQAEQKITVEQREKYQADILKLVLTLYLEILKARPEKLMAPVLEGLARYGHQMNLDLMGDFLQVLRELSEELLANQKAENSISSNQMRQILLCIITSFSLVSHMPPKKVHLDLNRFIDYLYSLLPVLSQDPDIEFSHKTLRLLDPLSTELRLVKPSVNVSTEAELLLRCLNAIFFNSRSGSNSRALAFTKRLYLNLLQFPEKTSIAVLKFVDKLMSRYDEVKCLYTTDDRIENGVYHADSDSIERANTEVAVLWENVLLEKHYNPTVVMSTKSLIKRAKGRDIIN